MLSRRCAAFDVPGIGIVTGEICSSHASATRAAVAPCEAAIACRSLARPAVRRPFDSGYHGTNAIACDSQARSTSVAPLGEVVAILNSGDRDDRLRGAKLPLVDVRDPDVADQAGGPEIRELRPTDSSYGTSGSGVWK